MSNSLLTESRLKLPPVDVVKQRRLRQKLQRAQTADHYYFIDVVGTCNLRCPSCPVGNVDSSAPKGFMPLDRLRQTLAKISDDQGPGKKIFVDLYNWGEPTLHPDLAACVRLVHEFGFGCGISSNMNVFPNMREVIKAQPDYIRVSLSGYYNENYQLTHRGGDINAVKGNMHLLRHYMDRYRSETVVQVGFHIYRSNFPDDFLKMRELCDELGFIFAPVIATMMPAEKAVDAIDGHIESRDAAIHEKFVIPLARWAELYRKDRVSLPDCQFRQSRTTINYDGSVSLCCAVYNADKTIAPDFLQIDDSSLKRGKYSHSFCDSCMSHSMHQMYTGVSSPSLLKEAADVLGPLYREFLEQERRLDDPNFIYWDGAFLPVQDIYDRAMAALTPDGDLSTAEAYFTALVEQAPTFGEGFFQAARIAEAREDRERAVRLMMEAVRLAPGHPPYAQELGRLQDPNYRRPNRHPQLRLKETYEQGLAALNAGDAGLSEAERCFEVLITEAPDFGEGFFQAARVAERRGDRDRAISLMATAARLAPNHTVYCEELMRLQKQKKRTA